MKGWRRYRVWDMIFIRNWRRQVWKFGMYHTTVIGSPSTYILISRSVHRLTRCKLCCDSRPLSSCRRMCPRAPDINLTIASDFLKNLRFQDRKETPPSWTQEKYFEKPAVLGRLELTESKLLDTMLSSSVEISPTAAKKERHMFATCDVNLYNDWRQLRIPYLRRICVMRQKTYSQKFESRPWTRSALSLLNRTIVDHRHEGK